MFRLAFFFVLLLGGCGRSQQNDHIAEPDWKEDYSAIECRRLSDTLIERCGGNIARASEILHQNPALCEPFSPPEKMSGMWELDLEHSAFFEGVDDVRQLTLSINSEEWNYTWLEVPDIAGRRNELAAMQGDGRRVYRVELIGRRSICNSGFGHMGGYPHEVLLQRIVSQEAVLPP